MTQVQITLPGWLERWLLGEDFPPAHRSTDHLEDNILSALNDARQNQNQHRKEASAARDGKIFYYMDWFNLTDAEAAIFGINPALQNRLCKAMCAYETFIGIGSDGYTPTPDERALWAEKYASDLDRSPEGLPILMNWKCARFMSEEFGLPLKDCEGWAAKQSAWRLRHT